MPSRSQLLESLDQQWLEIGGNNAKVKSQDVLAAETVRLLGCGPELYQLVQTLENRGHLYGSAKIGDELSRLFHSTEAAAARRMFASIPEVSVPGKQFATLEAWSSLAGKGCPAEEFETFHASLKNRGCAQEALLGRSLALMETDPDAAVEMALGIRQSDVQSRTKQSQLIRLFMADLPPGPYYDAAAKGVAIYFCEYQPEKAREIVLKMSHPELREKALKQLDDPPKDEGG